jgi:asparagine synthase (glutamine-hydrolysing)
MSGGLDSATVAASAQRILTRYGNRSSLQAYAEVFDNLIPHEERRYASMVADALKIPILFQSGDSHQVFDGENSERISSPEPLHSPLGSAGLNQLRQVAGASRVVLTGDGGDPGLCGRISVHFRQLIAKKQFGHALRDAARYLSVEGRLSRLYLRTRWRVLFATGYRPMGCPVWFDEALGNRLVLRDRWALVAQPAAPVGTVRPEAYEAILDTTLPNMSEEYDAGLTRVPIEARYPFFDLRLTSFLLALPRLPWCCDKQLLREAGRGILPDAIRLRRKSPLQSDPLVALLRRPEASWVDHFEAVPELGQYVVRNRIPAVHGETDSWAAWIHLRPLSLNFWLRGRAQ